MFISFLYTFRVTLCPSSGETTALTYRQVCMPVSNTLHFMTYALVILNYPLVQE